MTTRYDEAYAESLSNPRAFWARAAEQIEWFRRSRAILDDSDPQKTVWFPGAVLNTCYNALDLHVQAGRGEQAALVYDSPVTGVVRRYTYSALRDETARLAGLLASLGVERGDRVLLYMPMIPEAVIGMLATRRAGLVRHQLHAKDALGRGTHGVGALANLDAAALAAPAGVDLRLDDGDCSAELGVGGYGRIDAGALAALGHGHPKARQQPLGLKFVDFHGSPES